MIQTSGSIRLRDAIVFARRQNASDVHLLPGIPPAIRVDGDLERLPENNITPSELEEIAAQFASSNRQSCREGDLELSLAWNDDELGTMRVHLFRAGGSTSVAVRLLPRAIPAFESLDLPAAVGAITEKQRGLVIIAGPTGSGKSTTMAALVDKINAERPRRIITIEDPIEYRHENRRGIVSQREIGRDARSLAAALRGALRADPDVIVVGEMRDADAMREALSAAETGHLVLTTLHTGDVPQTIDRIVDSFTGETANQIRGQLAGVILAVVCQRLVRTDGEKGRRLVAEVLIATDAVRNVIREGRSHQLRNMIATGRQFGMQTLEQHASELVARKAIAAISAGAL